MANAVVEQNETTVAVERALSGPQRFMKFLHDTREEMRKVVTPNRTEVQSTTIVVIVTVFLFAAYFDLVDVIFGKSLDKLLVHLTRH
jgi:preprotein translocase subunit SecE